MKNDSTVPEDATTPLVHKEAFCLMEYQNKETGETETIWNSRDGVTPFAIRGRKEKGGTFHHINWTKDKFAPNHVPKVGDPIFVDFDISHALPISRKYVEEHWDKGTYQMKDHPIFGLMSKEEAVGCHAQASIERGDRPYLFVVTEEWLKESAELKVACDEFLRRNKL